MACRAMDSIGVFLSVLTLMTTIEIGSAECGKTVTRKYGSVYYRKAYSSYHETCHWTFNYLNRSDVTFSIQMTMHETQTHYESITLPDGSKLERTSSRTLSSTTQPWCGVYVKRNLGNETTCKFNVTLPSTCDRPSRYSEVWPPKITSYLYWYEFLITYAFIECPDSEKVFPETTTSTVSPTTNYLSTKNAATSELAKTEKSTTETTPITKEKPPPTGQAAPIHNDAPTVAAIVMALLFIITASALAALLIKQRCFTQRETSNKQVNPPASNPRASASNQRELVDNVLYRVDGDDSKLTYELAG